MLNGEGKTPIAQHAERKRAVVGVARKLAIVLHHLWKTGEIYDPFYLARMHDQTPESVPAAA